METAIVEILKGVPVAGVLFYFAVQFRKDSTAAQNKYESLVNKVIDGFSKQNTETLGVMNRTNNILERVERKLDDKQH